MRTPLQSLAIVFLLSSAAVAVSAPLRQVKLRIPAGTSLQISKNNTDMRLAVELASRWGTVSSVTRTREHNLAVGGAANSYHLIGRAIDVARRSGVRHTDIEAALLSAGYALLESLDEGDHSHFAFANGAPRNLNRSFRVVETSDASCRTKVSNLASPRSAQGRAGGDCTAGSKPEKVQVRLVADEAAGKLVIKSGTIRVETPDKVASK
jgi:hypothetical protein